MENLKAVVHFVLAEKRAKEKLALCSQNYFFEKKTLIF
jgi:hypothetical protein